MEGKAVNKRKILQNTLRVYLTPNSTGPGAREKGIGGRDGMCGSTERDPGDGFIAL